MKMVYVKEIEPGIRVVKRTDKRTGESEIHLQSLFNGKWYIKGTIRQFENVAA